MSKCISRHGEYSEHQLDQDHVCRRCSVLDEDAMVAELNRLRGELELLRPVVEAAKEVVYCWKSGRLDHYVGIVENKLATAVDALGADSRAGQAGQEVAHG